MKRRRMIAGLGAGLAAGGLLPLLGGCGFQPLYGQNNRRVLDRTSIAIDKIPDRNGQMLHNALRDRLAPRGLPTDPSHRLQVTLVETSGSLSTVAADNLRSFLELTATFQLSKTGQRGPALLDASRSRRVYYPDVASATVVSQAQADARQRGLQLLADDIARAVNLTLLRGSQG